MQRSQAQNNSKVFSPLKTPISFIRSNIEIIRYFLFIVFCAAFIFIFSIIMITIVNARNTVDEVRRFEVTNVYRGELMQNAPVLNEISSDSLLYKEGRYSQEQLNEFIKNSVITATRGKMILTADFVKKGLQYEPTFQTHFEADYTLKNNLSDISVVSFEFPFPSEVANSEISNVKLVVDGKEITKAKAKIVVNGQSIDGLKWEGKLDGNAEAKIHVSYNTVGISGLNYQGFENTTGSQDFAMELKIIGTRDYNLAGGLSVDKRIFGDKQVVLVWDKKHLFSTPSVHVNIGRKLAPSIQVSKVYAMMMPLYILYAGMLVWFGYKNKRKLYFRDLFLTTILFALYFPLWHYFTSFTIDPTMEFFSNFKQINYFSMSLYGGFAIAFIIIGGLLSWFYSAIYGVKNTINGFIPATVICFGFFPLSMTVPDYSVLLLLLGIVVLATVWIRFRLQEVA